MDGRPTWTDCDEAGDYVVPNVLSPRDLVFRPDKIDETVPHTKGRKQLQQPIISACNEWCNTSKKTTTPPYPTKIVHLKFCLREFDYGL